MPFAVAQRGYPLKDTPRDQIIAAVNGTTQGQTFIDSDIGGKLLQHIAHQNTLPETSIIESLNEREREMLKLVGRRFSHADIAEQMHLSVGTVRNYRSLLFEKLNIPDLPKPRSRPALPSG